MASLKSRKDILNMLKPRRIIFPILIGVGVVTFMLVHNIRQDRFEEAPEGKGNYSWHDKNENEKKEVEEFTLVEDGKGKYVRLTYKDAMRELSNEWAWYSAFWLLIAALMMAVRDVSYMYRIRVLTDNQISWRNSFDVIFLWEFASALSPSVVGGSAVAIFIVNKEGINTGRSTALVLITSLLDELFYVIMVPVLFLIVGTDRLFPENTAELFEKGIKGVFVLCYFLIFLYAVIISYAIFARPRGFKWILLRIFSIPLLRKWRYKAHEVGNDIITTSKELKDKPISFWVQAFMATFASWTGRFWVVNFIILAFVSANDQFLIYARQLVMWVIMLFGFTPGSSGVAEYAFTQFLSDFIPFGATATLALAFIWRLISYYPYLFIGVIVLPRWLRRVFGKSVHE